MVCGSLMVSYMPSLMCVEIGLWFTYTPYPNHTIVITVKKWFVVHLHTTPTPFLSFIYRKKWFAVVCGGLGWFAVVCGGLR